MSPICSLLIDSLPCAQLEELSSGKDNEHIHRCLLDVGAATWLGVMGLRARTMLFSETDYFLCPQGIFLW